MGKKVEKKSGEKVFVVDVKKKENLGTIIEKILSDKSFPDLTAESIGSIAKSQNVSEKNLKVFANRLQKFFKFISKGKKEKSITVELETEVKNAAILMAEAIGQKYLKSGNSAFKGAVPKFLKIVTTKKSDKKGKLIASGKVIFNVGNKDYFLYWDYRNNTVYTGGSLHERDV